MNNIYTCKGAITFNLLCRKSVGNKNDRFGRFFEKGKIYKANLEPNRRINIDTNYKRCTLVWVNYNDGFGSRFKVVGNIYNKGKPIWDDFRTVFYCPLERTRKIKKIICKIKKKY